MNAITFQNDGILDPVSIVTFGVNAKDSDNPIGYFGTGLKYAIAVLLREDCHIEIKAGGKQFQFSKQQNSIRGKSFDLVCMNKEPIGFTTELGKNWDVWQAFRELYCNALDEFGNIIDGIAEHKPHQTTVTVKGNKFYRCYEERESIYITGKPYIRGGITNIHLGSNPYVFYKGVRISELRKPSIYTYNITSNIQITEDRTAMFEYQIMDRLVDCALSCDDPDVIENIILAGKNHYESMLNFKDRRATPTDTFLDTAQRLRLHIKLNESVIDVLSSYRRLPEPEEFILNDVQKMQLKKAAKFCSLIGYRVDTYPIKVTSQLKGGLMGLAEKDTIFLSSDAFGFGTKYIASTLIEEYLHLHTGYGDCTRELQNHMFNDIVSLGERVVGEPI